MKHWLMKICFVSLGVSAALALQKKTAPLAPANEGPSLEVTMKFIQDKVNGIGPVNYVSYVHDNAVGNDWTVQSKIEIAKVVANPSTCHIGYRIKAERAGTVIAEGDGWFFLKDVGDISVVPGEQAFREDNTAAGHPSYSSKNDPPVWRLLVRRTELKTANDFWFFDEQLANRVAKALVHAVELCGGGSEPEPF